MVTQPRGTSGTELGGGDGWEVLQCAGCGRRLHARGKAAASYVTRGRAAGAKLGNAALGGNGPIHAGGLGVPKGDRWHGRKRSDAIQQRTALLHLSLHLPNPDVSW